MSRSTRRSPVAYIVGSKARSSHDFKREANSRFRIRERDALRGWEDWEEVNLPTKLQAVSQVYDNAHDGKPTYVGWSYCWCDTYTWLALRSAKYEGRICEVCQSPKRYWSK